MRLGSEEVVVLEIPLALPAPDPKPLVAYGLTPAERAVAMLALQGLPNADIAKQRRTSRATVAKQLETIYRKTGIGSRAELAALLEKRPRGARRE